jgi:uncharacterized protein
MTRILVFAKQPLPGRVKTRLIPELGAEGAAKTAQRMLNWTVREALATGLAVELCGDPDASGWYQPKARLELTAQGEGDLGERLSRAARRALQLSPVLLVGSDCPELGRTRLAAAAQSLATHDTAAMSCSVSAASIRACSRGSPGARRRRLRRRSPGSRGSAGRSTFARRFATWTSPPTCR